MGLSITSDLSEKDDVLKPIIEVVNLPHLVSTQDVFHDLMSCIIEQQIHYRSTKKTFAKLLQKSEIELLTPDNFSVLEEKALTDVKLSGRKYETMVQVLEFFQQNAIDWQNITDEEVRKTLGSIKGVGKWTIDMILLYTLERDNIFPVDDYHLKQLMVKLYKLDPKTKLAANMKVIAEHWEPYRSYGVKYLLAFKEFEKAQAKLK
ncbi:hypothetical protein BKI52_06225 [marine bacterium AO1-C]|nr:hypothetical protein BKI52_06225 [marine bacterium AO1-C]